MIRPPPPPPPGDEAADETVIVRKIECCCRGEIQLPERHAALTATLKTPVTFPTLIIREAIAVPPAVRVSLPGFRDNVGPPLTTGTMEDVRLTVPEKPFTPVRVRFSRIWVPGEVVMLPQRQFNETLKSGNTVNTRVVALERVPFEPDTVTV